MGWKPRPQERAGQRSGGGADDERGAARVPAHELLECREHTGVKSAADDTATTEHETDPRTCHAVTITERDGAARATNWPYNRSMATSYTITKRAEWLHGLSIDETEHPALDYFTQPYDSVCRRYSVDTRIQRASKVETPC